MSNAADPLANPIKTVKGVGPKLASLLKKKGIETLEDALYFLPRAYEDRRRVTAISQLLPGTRGVVFGTVVQSRMIRQGPQNRLEVMLRDASGSIRLCWFRAFPSMAAEFAVGNSFLCFGAVDYFHGVPQIVHPEYERVTLDSSGKLPVSAHFGRVVPVYSETDGLHQKGLRRLLSTVLSKTADQLDDPLPEDLRKRLDLPNLRDSFIGVHFPKEAPEDLELTPALKRIIFEEFFVLQLGLGLKKRQEIQVTAPAFTSGRPLLKKFIDALPFALTSDQKTAIDEIVKDLTTTVRMARLVQGDVGAGKTVVAMAGSALCIGAGYQSAMMAPTEVLAQQHYRTAEKLLTPLGIRVALLTSSSEEKRKLIKRVGKGELDFVVGTHALFQQGVEFSNLGLVTVDEQHRFGVEQRTELVRKAKDNLSPHLLMMTATPIPRTLALTLYGDLNLTLIREKPAGRKPVTTRVLHERERPKLYLRIRETVARGEQVYLIYPLVEASEKLDLKSATEMFHRLKQEVFPDIPMQLLHGRMKSQEKDRILAEFKSGAVKILVSTTVIEVGIDVPNATLMVIEHAERLGLSQLHQLRGRVGRGDKSSQCLLVATGRVTERLSILEQTEDGFVIAEEDLRLRGPGEFLGTRQSGLPGFRVGHIIRDANLLTLARVEAERVLSSDPELAAPLHQKLRILVDTRWRNKLERLSTG